MRKLLFAAPIVIFVALLGFFWRGLDLDPSRVPSPLIGKQAPQLALLPLSEAKPGLSSEDFTGRVTLVNFFASWCLPCRVEHPLLMELAKRNDLDIVAINYKDEPEAALTWLKRLGDPYRRIGVDADGRTAIDWGVYGVPESFLIGRDGNILYKQIGPFTEQDVTRKLLPLLTEASR